MTPATCDIQCDTRGCAEWVRLSHCRAVHIEEQAGKILCRACLGGDP